MAPRKGRLVLDVSLSLDGFSAGPDVGPAHPLGRGGEALRAWMSAPSQSEAARAVAGELLESCGAVITGRRTFDLGVELWGGVGASGLPCFVLTHRARPEPAKGEARFTFVLEGVLHALELARAAAGAKDVWLMGAADVARQFLRAGLVDELRVHLVPVLLGRGARLFEGLGATPPRLERTRLIEGPGVTHLGYRVSR